MSKAQKEEKPITTSLHNANKTAMRFISSLIHVIRKIYIYCGTERGPVLSFLKRCGAIEPACAASFPVSTFSCKEGGGFR